jgi:hypothetical protein
LVVVLGFPSLSFAVKTTSYVFPPSVNLGQQFNSKTVAEIRVRVQKAGAVTPKFAAVMGPSLSAAVARNFVHFPSSTFLVSPAGLSVIVGADPLRTVTVNVSEEDRTGVPLSDTVNEILVVVPSADAGGVQQYWKVEGFPWLGLRAVVGVRLVPVKVGLMR